MLFGELNQRAQFFFLFLTMSSLTLHEDFADGLAVLQITSPRSVSASMPGNAPRGDGPAGSPGRRPQSRPASSSPSSDNFRVLPVDLSQLKAPTGDAIRGDDSFSPRDAGGDPDRHQFQDKALTPGRQAASPPPPPCPSPGAMEKRSESHQECDEEGAASGKQPGPLDSVSYAKTAAESLVSLLPREGEDEGAAAAQQISKACSTFVRAMQQLLPKEKPSVRGKGIVGFLCRAMAAYGDASSELLVNVYKAFAELAYSVDCPNHAFFDEAVFAAVLRGMRRFEAETTVQEHGCVAIRCFARCADNTVGIAQVGGLEHIIQSVTLHVDSAEIQVEGFKALFNLAFNSKNQNEVVRLGGLELVVKAFRRHQGAKAVNEFGCNLLHNLAFKNVENKAAIASSGCIERIVLAMKAHLTAPKVQIEACRALMSLAFAAECQNKIALEGGIDVIFGAMVALKQNRDVQIEACKVLCTLALNHMKNKERIAERMEIIIDVMRAHEASGELQSEGCSTLATLSFRSPQNKRKIEKCGGVDAILRGMAVHLDNKEVQVDGCKALASLAFDVELQLNIAAKGGIRTIMATMHHHLARTASVEAECCKALSELAYRCTENKKAIAEAGAAEAIVSAMGAHADNQSIHREGSRALFSLAIRSDNKPRILRTDIVPTVLRGMGQHGDAPTVQEHGCRLLAELMYFNPEVVERVRAGNGVATIVAAVLKHGKKWDVGAGLLAPWAKAGAEAAGSDAVEERARKALKYFKAQDIFEAVCEIFRAATGEAALVHAMRLFLLTKTVFDSPEEAGAGGASGSSEDSHSADGAEAASRFHDVVPSVVLERKALAASRKAKLLQMGKTKRGEDGDAWSRTVAQCFGQLLKFAKRV